MLGKNEGIHCPHSGVGLRQDAGLISTEDLEENRISYHRFQNANYRHVTGKNARIECCH